MKPSVFRRIIRGLCAFVLVLWALGTFGLLCPSIPILGELGPISIGGFGPWISIACLAGSAWFAWRWVKTRSVGAMAIAAAATFAAVGTIWVQDQQIAAARSHGVSIDLWEALAAGSQFDEKLQPDTVIYTRHDSSPLRLDIYAAAKGGNDIAAPILVYIHGGGWGAETLKQRQADYRWFYERGYLVISLEYTLSSKTRHTWNVAEPQLACALAWIARHASGFGGDPSRLALWGESAGGNLVLNLSYRANAGTALSVCGGRLPHVSATLALYPVVDPARMYRNPDPLIGVFGRMMTINYTGGTPEQYPGRYRAIASASHISNRAPPTLLIVPEADHLVAPQAAFDFAARSRGAGVDVRVIRMPYAEHAFDLRSGSIGNQLVRGAMLRFLTEHGLQPQSNAFKRAN